jgi:hypothetical protein
VQCGEEGEEQKEDCILFVGDLARGIEDYELEQAFAGYGRVGGGHWESRAMMISSPPYPARPLRTKSLLLVDEVMMMMIITPFDIIHSR